MELFSRQMSIAIATTVLFLLISTSSVFASPLARAHHRHQGDATHHRARGHVKPRLTLADLDEDGAIPQNDPRDIEPAVVADENDRQVLANQEPAANEGGEESDVHFDAVNLPSHFDTYDKNHDLRVSLLELAMVTGTKEIDAEAPFRAADLNGDGKISFEEFKQAPWIFGVALDITNDAAMPPELK